MARLLRRGGRGPRPEPGPLPADEAARAGPDQQVDFPATVSTPYVNTIPADEEPWFPGDEHMERRIRAFIRWNAAVMVVRANMRDRRHRRPPLHLRQLGRPLRGGLQPLLPGQGRRRRRRPGLLPGPRLAGHLRPGLRRGPAHRGAARQLPPRGRRATGCPATPTPAPARLLGVPHGLDGPRPHRRRLPGPRQPLPAPPPAGGHQRAAGCGASWATARWTSPSRSGRWGWPAASTSTTSSSSSTATCSASTARCGATARSSRSSRRSSAAPAGT